MQKLLLVALLMLLGVILGGCSIGPTGAGVQGSGNVMSDTRTVSGFDSVSLQTVGTLTVQMTGVESLSVEAEDNIIGHLKTTVQGTRLVIETEPGFSFNNTKPINYRLTVKTLKDL